MNIILFDKKLVSISLQPFTFTRPVSEIRCGIFTISEKWKNYFKQSQVSYLTFEKYLSKIFKTVYENNNLYINGSVLPNLDLIHIISQLKENECLVFQNEIIAVKSSEKLEIEQLQESNFKNKIEISFTFNKISKKWHIFQLNGSEIKSDFEYIRKNFKNYYVNDSFTKCYNSENIFVEESAKIYASVLNANTGPIYIGKNTEVQEGSLIRGSFALCEGSTTNMGSKMRGDVTIGPYSKVGGEVSNSVIFGYSNKAHDGFLGNSVIGEWCNLGADSNTSNLKNNYSNVSLFDYKTRIFEDTKLTFCGLMMGDHSKCGINTMFNTGTVVGVSANIFGSHFPPKHIPSFSWGGSEGMEIYTFEKAIEVAKKVYERRNLILSENDILVLKQVFELEK